VSVNSLRGGPGCGPTWWGCRGKLRKSCSVLKRPSATPTLAKWCSVASLLAQSTPRLGNGRVSSSSSTPSTPARQARVRPCWQPTLAAATPAAATPAAATPVAATPASRRRPAVDVQIGDTRRARVGGERPRAPAAAAARQPQPSAGSARAHGAARAIMAQWQIHWCNQGTKDPDTALSGLVRRSL
jgi:hypothetical protein